MFDSISSDVLGYAISIMCIVVVWGMGFLQGRRQRRHETNTYRAHKEGRAF